jgi:hypothetical protein
MLPKRPMGRWLLAFLAIGAITLTICSSAAGKETAGASVPDASAITLHQGSFRGTMELVAVVSVPLSDSVTFASDTKSLSVSIQRGWKTYTFGKAAISVPRTWAVRHRGYSCVKRIAPVAGTLFLLSQSSSDLCVRSNVNSNSVTISPLPAGNTYRQPLCPPVKVNRLTTYIGPCSSSNAAGITVWSVPALGVQALGTGTASENVTGRGNGTIVGRILHTLRRRQ